MRFDPQPPPVETAAAARKLPKMLNPVEWNKLPDMEPVVQRIVEEHVVDHLDVKAVVSFRTVDIDNNHEWMV